MGPVGRGEEQRSLIQATLHGKTRGITNLEDDFELQHLHDDPVRGVHRIHYDKVVDEQGGHHHSLERGKGCSHHNTQKTPESRRESGEAATTHLGTVTTPIGEKIGQDRLVHNVKQAQKTRKGLLELGDCVFVGQCSQDALLLDTGIRNSGLINKQELVPPLALRFASEPKRGSTSSPPSTISSAISLPPAFDASRNSPNSS